MKQDKTGSVVVTGVGEGLAEASKGPLSEGPICTDWREKAFELASDLNAMEETMAVQKKAFETTVEGLELEIKQLSYQLSQWKMWAGIGWLTVVALLLTFGLKGG